MTVTVTAVVIVIDKVIATAGTAAKLIVGVTYTCVYDKGGDAGAVIVVMVVTVERQIPLIYPVKSPGSSALIASGFHHGFNGHPLILLNIFDVGIFKQTLDLSRIGLDQYPVEAVAKVLSDFNAVFVGEPCAHTAGVGADAIRVIKVDNRRGIEHHYVLIFDGFGRIDCM